MIVNYQLGNELISLELIGETYSGTDEILLLQDENLIENTSWKNEGFSIEKFLEEDEFLEIKNGIKVLITEKIKEAGGIIDDNFSLDNYHNYVNNELHLKIASLIQNGWNVSKFPIQINAVNRRISDVIGRQVSTKAKHVEMNNFFVRIVRPQNFQDNNPPHRDVWLD
jgi:hypothetical protein